MTGKNWIGHVVLLPEVSSTSIEYCEVFKILRIIGSPQIPGSPGPLFIPTYPSANILHNNSIYLIFNFIVNFKFNSHRKLVVSVQYNYIAQRHAL